MLFRSINLVSLALSIPLFMVVPVTLKVSSLAVAYVLAYWVALIVAWPRLQRRLGDLESSATVRSLARSAVATMLAALPAGIVMAVVGTADLGRIALLLVVSAVSSLMLVTYVTLAHRMRIDEVTWAVEALRGRLVRGMR